MFGGVRVEVGRGPGLLDGPEQGRAEAGAVGAAPAVLGDLGPDLARRRRGRRGRPGRSRTQPPRRAPVPARPRLRPGPGARRRGGARRACERTAAQPEPPFGRTDRSGHRGGRSRRPARPSHRRGSSGRRADSGGCRRVRPGRLRRSRVVAGSRIGHVPDPGLDELHTPLKAARPRPMIEVAVAPGEHPIVITGRYGTPELAGPRTRPVRGSRRRTPGRGGPRGRARGATRRPGAAGRFVQGLGQLRTESRDHPGPGPRPRARPRSPVRRSPWE